MSQQTTHWFEYGDPVGDERVEATLRQVYHVGDSGSKQPDETTHGTIAVGDLELLETHSEISKHVHDDGAVLLSALSERAERKLLRTFEKNTASLEIKQADQYDYDGWEYNLSIHAIIENPYNGGEDVIMYRKYRARPTRDDVTDSPGSVHGYCEYWFRGDSAAVGDSPFFDDVHQWMPYADLHNDSELTRELVETVRHDPDALFESLVENVPEHSRAHDRLTGERTEEVVSRIEKGRW